MTGTSSITDNTNHRQPDPATDKRRMASLSSTERLRQIVGTATSGDRPYVLLLALAALIIGFAIMSPVFLTVQNIENIGRQTALVSIMAVGMTLTIIAGEIDLSVGSVLGLATMTAALAMQDLANIWVVGMVAGLLTGAFVGLVNGAVTTWLKIPSFLTTLGTMGIAYGVALLLTNTVPVTINNNSFQTIFGTASIIGIPISVVWTLGAVAIGVLVLHFSVWGRKIYAVGGNKTAAVYSGIRANRVKIGALLLTGALAGMAGLILAAQSDAGNAVFGSGIELNVIAATIIGGTSLFGGRGTIVGAVLGSLLIGIINNGMILVGLNSSAQLVVQGAIIIVAVAFTSRVPARKTARPGAFGGGALIPVTRRQHVASVGSTGQMPDTPPLHSTS